jgi:hypothetical protein
MKMLDIKTCGPCPEKVWRRSENIGVFDDG